VNDLAISDVSPFCPVRGDGMGKESGAGRGGLGSDLLIQ
jgi:hypothetical protein